MRAVNHRVFAVVSLCLGLCTCALAQGVPEAPAVAAPLTRPALVAQDTVNAAHTGWMMTSTALVLLMTLPGIALFYAGMVRRKNVLNTMASVVAIAALVSLLWFAAGYSLAFTPGSAWLGGWDRAGFAGLDFQLEAGKLAVSHIAPLIPEPVYAMFQLTFAIITAALLVGAFVERMRFSAMLVFISLWTLVVYAPVAHWVWEPGGWLAQMGALDFAGGSVVHVNAGVAGLVCAWFLGRRAGYGREPFEPYNLGLTMAGAGMLWVGWFGFNAGSALEANASAALAFVNTLVATAAAVLAWSVGEAMHKGKASMLGAASGAVAGLVAITPACGSVGPMGAIVIGLVSGFACLWGVSGLKRMLGADDSLDVFGVHGVGGIVGAVLVGVFASPSLGGTGAEGFSIGSQVLIQLEGVVITMVWSSVVALAAYKIVDMVVGLRVSEEDEREGLDIRSHGETAYNR